MYKYICILCKLDIENLAILYIPLLLHITEEKYRTTIITEI
jgi:hypothetical protein